MYNYKKKLSVKKDNFVLYQTNNKCISKSCRIAWIKEKNSKSEELEFFGTTDQKRTGKKTEDIPHFFLNIDLILLIIPNF